MQEPAEAGSASAKRHFGVLSGGQKLPPVFYGPQGGGGTIAKYLEERGIDIVDLGVYIVGMHSPFELSSVQDLSWGLRGFTPWLSEGRAKIRGAMRR